MVKNKDNNLVKLVLTLTIIGIVSAVSLAFVYEWTIPYINEVQARKQKKAVFAVLPGADEYKEVHKDGVNFFEGYSESGQRVGVAIIATGGGFQGMIDVMVGTDTQTEKIYGIKILSHMETPGLGARITEAEYKNNFKNKPFEDYDVVKGIAKDEYDVVAISGATISSTKVTNIVEKAIQDIKRVYGSDE
jgi:electron transport complex protein RnfG